MRNKVESPCIKVCKYDDEGICEGCYRSMEEITGWLFMNDRQKLESLKKAEERKKRVRREENDYDYYV